jgi:hypothetical protein
VNSDGFCKQYTETAAIVSSALAVYQSGLSGVAHMPSGELVARQLSTQLLALAMAEELARLTNWDVAKEELVEDAKLRAEVQEIRKTYPQTMPWHQRRAER